MAVPLKFTTDEATKLVPFTVSVKAAPPADALVGESEVIVGTGLFTANAEFADVPPPGAGLVTVTLNVPAAAMSAAVIAAVTCVALTKVVVAAAPLKFTTDDELKFVPFTVSVKAVPPANALVGESEVIVGNGLFTVNGEIARSAASRSRVCHRHVERPRRGDIRRRDRCRHLRRVHKRRRLGRAVEVHN